LTGAPRGCYIASSFKIHGPLRRARRLQSIQGIVAGVFAILLGLSVHEYAHARAARAQGDYTAEELGRITLNPLAHIDLFGTIIVPILLLVSSSGRVGFGWAKPVPVNAYNFKSPRRGLILVSLAGPASNIALATLAAIVLRLTQPLLAGGVGMSFILILGTIILLNLYLAFFNLIPVPPLDGSGVLSAILPLEWARRYESIGRFGMLVLILLIATGGIHFLAGMPAHFLFRLLVGEPAYYLFFSLTG
jgi:Zn-dependent protease